MSDQQIDLYIGQSAHDVLDDAQFLSAWKSLHDHCPHATGFQSPAFVRSWYETYQSVYQPVIVCSKREKGDLRGLWLLAFNPARHELVHAGAHQAEYHVWLALPGSDSSFLESAWKELQRQLPFDKLRFQYLPEASLAGTLRAVAGMEDRMAIRVHSRPLLKLNAAEIKASFAKKSNKSRFNRLKNLGPLEFQRITELEQLDQVLDDIIAFYDFRQGAVNRTMPFHEDPLKRAFHKALFTVAPEEASLTVTYLHGRAIAALWGTISGKTVHLGITAYSPFIAAHSPGKLHIMQLIDHLLKEGKEVLDLTPGGDPWKERFANAHDTVAEVLLYRSSFARSRARAFNNLLAYSKLWAAKTNVQPSDVRQMLVKFRRTRPSAFLRKVSNWVRTQRELRVYRGDRELSARFVHDSRIAKNSLTDLLRFQPCEMQQSRDMFLSNALACLEKGESVYTVCVDGHLAHYGWMVLNQTESFLTEVQQSITLPEGSVVLYNSFTHPNYRGRGLYRATIGHMLREAFTNVETQYVYISVLADNLPSRHVIKSMGFQHQGSLYWKCRFGLKSKWTDPIFVKKELPPV